MIDNNKSVTILGIESSCDDTSAAVIRDGLLLSNVIASQSVHEEYGGVVPELASRAHQQNIVPVVDQQDRPLGHSVHTRTGAARLAACWHIVRQGAFARPAHTHCGCEPSPWPRAKPFRAPRTRGCGA